MVICYHNSRKGAQSLPGSFNYLAQCLSWKATRTTVGGMSQLSGACLSCDQREEDSQLATGPKEETRGTAVERMKCSQQGRRRNRESNRRGSRKGRVSGGEETEGRVGGGSPTWQQSPSQEHGRQRSRGRGEGCLASTSEKLDPLKRQIKNPKLLP